MTEFSEIQTDALTEIFNISIGKAAAMMSRIVNDTIELRVPKMKFANIEEASNELSEGSNGDVCGIVQHFDGPFSTDAILMFPQAQSLEIVRMMVGSQHTNEELTDMEQDAMAEIGNIILNTCISTIADIIKNHFDSSMPTVRVTEPASLLLLNGYTYSDAALIVYIDFTVATKKISGSLLFLMSVPSLDGLKNIINKFLKEAYNIG